MAQDTTKGAIMDSRGIPATLDMTVSKVTHIITVSWTCLDIVTAYILAATPQRQMGSYPQDSTGYPAASGRSTYSSGTDYTTSEFRVV